MYNKIREMSIIFNKSYASTKHYVRIVKRKKENKNGSQTHKR
jgi:hypothetical protein